MKELNKHSETTVSFTLEVENRDALAFLPGQYVNIKVPGTDAERSYSFSSGPEVQDASFMVRVTPQGAMSEYLRDRAAVGDTVEFTGPYGSFFLREPKRPLLLLAGGTGLAPLLSILEKLSENPPSAPVHLIYGLTREADIVGLDWLREYEAKLPGFTWDYIASEPGTSAPHTGYVTQIIEPSHLNDGDVDIYLCGPASHGQRSVEVAGLRGHQARQLLLRALCPEGNHWGRRGNRRTGTRGEDCRPKATR